MKLEYFTFSPENRRRILMTLIGVLITGFSVGMFNFSHFGMDPFQVCSFGVWMHTSLGYGTFYTLTNLLMLIGVFFVDRTKIGLGTMINIFLLGYMVQFSSWLFTTWIPEPLLIQRIALLLIGIVLLCFGSSLYFTANLGVSTYDAVALVMSEKKLAPFPYCRISTDLVCTITGVLLGATAGIGTLITALFMGPIIAFFNNKVSIPLRYGKHLSEH